MNTHDDDADQKPWWSATHQTGLAWRFHITNSVNFSIPHLKIVWSALYRISPSVKCCIGQSLGVMCIFSVTSSPLSRKRVWANVAPPAPPLVTRSASYSERMKMRHNFSEMIDYVAFGQENRPPPLWLNPLLTSAAFARPTQQHRYRLLECWEGEGRRWMRQRPKPRTHRSSSCLFGSNSEHKAVPFFARCLLGRYSGIQVEGWGEVRWEAAHGCTLTDLLLSDSSFPPHCDAVVSSWSNNETRMNHRGNNWVGKEGRWDVASETQLQQQRGSLVPHAAVVTESSTASSRTSSIIRSAGTCIHCVFACFESKTLRGEDVSATCLLHRET